MSGFNWIFFSLSSYLSSFPLFLSCSLGNNVNSITLGSISFHSRLQLKCMEEGDRLANRWVMCGLWMTSSGALRESLSKCSSSRVKLTPQSTNHFEEKLTQRLFLVLFFFSFFLPFFFFTAPLSEFKCYRFMHICVLVSARRIKNILFSGNKPFSNS